MPTPSSFRRLVSGAKLEIVCALLCLIFLFNRDSIARLAWGPQVAVAAVSLVAFGVVCRRLIIWLFGPILFYEVIRASRRGRLFLLRMLFGISILLFLSFVYLKYEPAPIPLTPLRFLSVTNASPNMWIDLDDFGGDPNAIMALRAKELARFNETFFFTFMCVQFATVLLLTPVFAAGTIAEEKDRRRLEFLLTTDLRNREIVLGKLFASLASLSLLLIAGLPILSVLQLLGGVDPDLVVAGYIGTAVTMFSLASLSILNSVYGRKPREAILLTYLTLGGYLILSLLLLVPIDYVQGPQAIKTGWLPEPPTLLERIARPFVSWMENFNTGNPIIMLATLKNDWQAGTPMKVALANSLESYTEIHLVFGSLCIAIAVWRMRRSMWDDGLNKAGEGPLWRLLSMNWRFQLIRPSLGKSPMLWKEVFTEPGLALLGPGKIVAFLIVLVSFAPLVWFIGKLGVEYASGYHHQTTWDELAHSINAWVRLAGSGVACMTLVGVAVRAASAISGERERQTLDSLLTTSLGAREIVFAKWLGSLLSVRGAWLWLLTIWGIGVLTGGLHLATLPWLVLAWLVYAACFAALGLRFSFTSGGTLRATLLTLTVLGLLCLGHWLPWFFIKMPRSAEWPYTLQMYGLTPPAAIAWLSFKGDAFTFDPLAPTDHATFHNEDPMGVFFGIMFGLIAWAALAWFFWSGALARFRALSRGATRQAESALS
jgi:ABC-type transport system involved in multi-copper enzyme maturation permease subunit